MTMLLTLSHRQTRLLHEAQVKPVPGPDLTDPGDWSFSPAVAMALTAIPHRAFMAAARKVPASAFDDDLALIGDHAPTAPLLAGIICDLLNIKRGHRLLVIGNGMGYQTSLLSLLSEHITAMELRGPVAQAAESVWQELGLRPMPVILGDGSRGYPANAPYDRICLSASVELIPPMLLEQLAPGGRLIAPCGHGGTQNLTLASRGMGGALQIEPLLPVAFPPMITDDQRANTANLSAA